MRLACPVLFQAQQRQLWPLHWGGWVDEATVLIPMARVLDGSLDVLAFLAEVPPARVAHMQRVLRANAHRLHYARVGSPDAAGDALEITLAHLGAAQQGRERGGASGGARRHAWRPRTAEGEGEPPSRCKE